MDAQKNGMCLFNTNRLSSIQHFVAFDAMRH
ncbi:hypothetical protein HPL003_16250 [Paenibacillus terrae HPL-003]|uniref:Uncharacterized protein n=1 Tax=Paenibacillus terrae (strain HPL-003) TaxID=985665 RepID=G7W0Q9_PAETH|nr:hypothetical protein HPL003_16250 [Paenibacillus terrae HPL-003]